MAISRYATAHWEGDLKSGNGQIDTPQSGLMAATPYGFNTRFGDRKGVNPEELIAAAQASCFAMALSAKLSEAGHPPTTVDTRADVDLSMDGAPTISAIRIKVSARVPGLDAVGFRAIVDETSSFCPVSRALSAVPITVDAEFLGT